MPDTKDSTDERLVGVVSAESFVTSLHTVAATNLVFFFFFFGGGRLRLPPSLAPLKQCEMTK